MLESVEITRVQLISSPEAETFVLRSGNIVRNDVSTNFCTVIIRVVDVHVMPMPLKRAFARGIPLSATSMLWLSEYPIHCLGIGHKSYSASLLDISILTTCYP